MPDFQSLVESLHLELLAQLVLAMLLGGAIGMEREVSGKPAGLRTNILICVGATLFTVLSLRLAASILILKIWRRFHWYMHWLKSEPPIIP